jgi:hypothetical protein
VTAARLAAARPCAALAALAAALFAPAALAQTAPRAPAAAQAAPKPKALIATSAHGLGDTKCSSCHTTSGWQPVSFDHAQTGFILKGKHQKAGCFGCHTKNLSEPVPLACAGCHQDQHRGEFGARCAGCHDEESWKTNFTADAHRSTGFPLVGRHALISCEECHTSKRDRSFSRAGAAACYSCHQADYQAAAGRSIDHVAFGFATECRQCHTPSSFQPARFPDHDVCFQISGGPHAGIACLACHSSLHAASTPGSCNTNTAACTSCHTHDKARTDAIHAQPWQGNPSVPGYQYADRKCYECHRFNSRGFTAPPRGSGALRRQ